MRRIAARRAIAKVLLAHPDGIIAQQIIPLLDKNISRNSIIDARHVSLLLRGVKGVTKESKAIQVSTYNATQYYVANYTVSDVEALKKWGKLA
tara:strand:- start:62 stop:340 length:279 start_codon:yes stop_codon:yes gene_type:complete